MFCFICFLQYMFALLKCHSQCKKEKKNPALLRKGKEEVANNAHLSSLSAIFFHACWVAVGASVDGQWQEWSSWSDCSVTCANGTQQRTRQCSAAAHGGSECRGHWAESRECHNPDCTGKNPEPLHSISTLMSK